jgi:hypothetical protein
VFACPSVYEPLGIVNLEAMACGTAVVGSRTGGIPEVVAEGETGLLVPPGDPVAGPRAERAAGDPDRAEAMGQAGRKRAVAEFGWAAIAAQTRRPLAQIVIVSRPRRPEERGPPRNLGANLEAERRAVEVNGAGQIPDIKDSVVQAAYGHGASPGEAFVLGRMPRRAV